MWIVLRVEVEETKRKEKKKVNFTTECTGIFTRWIESSSRIMKYETLTLCLTNASPDRSATVAPVAASTCNTALSEVDHCCEVLPDWKCTCPPTCRCTGGAGVMRCTLRSVTKSDKYVWASNTSASLTPVVVVVVVKFSKIQ